MSVYDHQAAMKALLEARERVRVRRQSPLALPGPTHVFAELLIELEKDGWLLLKSDGESARGRRVVEDDGSLGNTVAALPEGVTEERARYDAVVIQMRAVLRAIDEVAPGFLPEGLEPLNHLAGMAQAMRAYLEADAEELAPRFRESTPDELDCECGSSPGEPCKRTGFMGRAKPCGHRPAVPPTTPQEGA